MSNAQCWLFEHLFMFYFLSFIVALNISLRQLTMQKVKCHWHWLFVRTTTLSRLKGSANSGGVSSSLYLKRLEVPLHHLLGVLVPLLQHLLLGGGSRSTSMLSKVFVDVSPFSDVSAIIFEVEEPDVFASASSHSTSAFFMLLNKSVMGFRVLCFFLIRQRISDNWNSCSSSFIVGF